MAQAKVEFDGRSQKVCASSLPSKCVYCGGQSEDPPLQKSIPYLSPMREPLSMPPQIAVELPVCHRCRSRGGKGISAEPKKGWVILGGVADGFAAAVMRLLEEQAAEFERGLAQNQPDEQGNNGGFDWTALK